MKKIIAVFALVLALILTASALADATARTLDEIKADGTLKIGVFSDKKPFGYIDENGESFTVKGTCEGRIGYEKKGTNGFGYDPIFMYGDRSFAEISAEEKDKVSHRADALRKFEARIKGE